MTRKAVRTIFHLIHQDGARTSSGFVTGIKMAIWVGPDGNTAQIDQSQEQAGRETLKYHGRSMCIENSGKCSRSTKVGTQPQHEYNKVHASSGSANLFSVHPRDGEAMLRERTSP